VRSLWYSLELAGEDREELSQRKVEFDNRELAALKEARLKYGLDVEERPPEFYSLEQGEGNLLDQDEEVDLDGFFELELEEENDEGDMGYITSIEDTLTGFRTEEDEYLSQLQDENLRARRVWDPGGGF
jgi:hypothetical protein